jgi:3-oxoadipate enol-lactonase
MPVVKVGDINMHYETYGKGEPFVAINGASSNSDWMADMIPAYSGDYRLVLFDNRGSGQTDAPDSPYSTEMMADDLAGLLDKIGIEAAHIYGASLGGMIAQQFVLRYPHRVKSLILACTWCGGPGSSMMTDPEVMPALLRTQPLPVKEGLLETLRLCLSRQFFESHPAQIQNMLELMMKHPISAHGSMRQNQAGMNHNTYDRLPEIKAPTLVISGDADKLIPVSNSRIIASRIPGAELVIIKNAGHMYMMEAAEESIRIELDFLKRHSQSPKTGKHSDERVLAEGRK